MKLEEVKELIKFISGQNKKVRNSITPNQSEYADHCRGLCLTTSETLDHILYCIEHNVDLDEYKEDNVGSKKDWFGIA